jgi:tetratricopeptide (TPR) repeat protein
MAEEQARGFIEQATQSLQGGQHQQALELLDQALALDPHNAETHILRGIALSQTNQPDLATAAFQQAILISPNAKGFYNLAVHQYQLGQKQPALDAAREAVRIDPAHAGAKDLVSRLEREMGLPQSGSAAAINDVLKPGEAPAQEGTMAGGVAGPGAGSPYGTTHSQAPQGEYYRQGYVPQEQVHSLKMVENMGKTWDTIGWAIVAAGGLVFILSIFVSFGAVMELLNNPAASAGQNPFMSTGGSVASLILNILGLFSIIASFTWMIMDIQDRRNNWLWILPLVICCCCGMNWAVVAVYMLGGRK